MDENAVRKTRLYADWIEGRSMLALNFSRRLQRYHGENVDRCTDAIHAYVLAFLEASLFVFEKSAELGYPIASAKARETQRALRRRISGARRRVSMAHFYLPPAPTAKVCETLKKWKGDGKPVHFFPPSWLREV